MTHTPNTRALIERAVARDAQRRCITHVWSATDCACATGGWCDEAQRLERESDDAWSRVARKEGW